MSTPRKAFSENNAYFQTLSAITATKSTIFDQQQASFVHHRERILAEQKELEATSQDALKKILKLVETSSLPPARDETRSYITPTPERIRQKLFAEMLSGASSAIDPPGAILTRLRILLAQGQLDPEVFGSEELLEEWKQTFLSAIEMEDARMKIANLISRLLGEWATASIADKGGANLYSTAEELDIKAEAKKEQIDMFTSLVFHPHSLDAEPEVLKLNISEYLDNLFHKTPQGTEFLNGVRKTMKSGCYSFPSASLVKHKLPRRMTPEVYIQRLVKAVAVSSVFTSEKRSFLKDHILPNKTILSEILDVIRMWTADLGSWTWESAGLGSRGGEIAVKLQPKFHLNGKYRVYLDLDPTTAIFAHHVGRWFSLRMKTSLREVFSSTVGAWAGGKGKFLEKKLAERLKAFTEPSSMYAAPSQNIECERRDAQSNTFFMSHITDRLDQQSPYEDATGSDNGDDDDTKNSGRGATTAGRQIKEQILNTLMTDFHLTKALSSQGGSKSFTVVVGDFKWFGPSLSHEMLDAVMRYFGFTADFVGFFRRYLNVPGYFDGEEAVPENIKRRVRGIPLDHPLCDMAAELVLFCLDYAVNQVSGGDVYLYRCFDDLWFWGEDESKCELVWKEIKKFSEIFGLDLNLEKSGSMTFNFGELGDIISTETANENLPQGPIHWGFLILTPEGRLAPDEDLVTGHITELTRQLSSAAYSSSILSFATAWNRYYAGFLPYHFAPPCHVLGDSHTSMVTLQLSRIQTAVLQNLNGGKKTTLVKYLRSEITRRFPDIDGENIPEAWFFWPHQLGGLGLRNPILKLGTQRVMKFDGKGKFDSSKVLEPEEILMVRMKKDRHLYRHALERFLEQNQSLKASVGSGVFGGLVPGSRGGRGRGDRGDHGNRGGGRGGRGRGTWDASSWEPHFRDPSVGWGLAETTSVPSAPPKHPDIVTEEEFCSIEVRLKFQPDWYHTYQELLSQPTEDEVDEETLPGRLLKLASEVEKAGKAVKLVDGNSYWRRIFAMYGPGVVRRWGGVQLVEKEWVPGGLLEEARAARIGWDE